MAQITMVGVQVNINSPADELYGFFKNNLPRMGQLFPDEVKSFAFAEGNEICDGAVVRYEYNIVGTPMTVKAKIEEEPGKSMTFTILEGDLAKHCKSFKAKFEVSAAGSVNWSMEFEKGNEGADLNLDEYLKFATKITKQLDAYLCKN